MIQTSFSIVMFVLSKIYTTQNAVTTLFYHTMYFGTVTRRSEVSLLLTLGQVLKGFPGTWPGVSGWSHLWPACVTQPEPSTEYFRFWARWPTYLVVLRYFCIDLAIVGHTSSATSDAAILLDAWRWTNENASSTAASSLDLRFLIRLSFSTWKIC